MVNTVSLRRETFLNRSKRVLSQVISQSRIAFSSTLLRPTLLMIMINFGIQFGYEHDFSSTRFIKSKHLSRIFEHSRKLINLNQMLFFFFSYYGLWLWFPELFNRLNKYYQNHNESVSVCQVVSYAPSNETDDLFEHCDTITSPDQSVFINAFIIALAPLPANIWTIYSMDKLGRKFFLGKIHSQT